MKRRGRTRASGVGGIGAHRFEQRPEHSWPGGVAKAFTAAVVATSVVVGGWLLVAGPSDGGHAARQSAGAMPGDNLRGWRLIFKDDFSRRAKIGSFPGRKYRSKWTVYPDGWKDTTGRGTYKPSKVLSVHDGYLDWYIHSHHGKHQVAAALPKVRWPSRYGHRTYGRYAIRFKADRLRGYKTAFLLWPNSDRWIRDGEIDFPEGDLNGNINAFAHYVRSRHGQAAFHTHKGFAHWHTAVIKWLPGRIVFKLDGRVIGRSTRRVPTAPMHWVLQAETSTTPGVTPNNSTAGHIKVDWVAVYAPS